MRTAIHCSPRLIRIAAPAPAVPATMKHVLLHRKSSRHTAQTDRPVDNAIAPATRPVFTTKYVVMAPTSGFAESTSVIGPSDPPSHAYASALAIIVNASAAMLNTVRYGGYGCLT